MIFITRILVFYTVMKGVLNFMMGIMTFHIEC